MENTLQKPKKGLDIAVLVTKIIYIALYAAFTAFLLYILISESYLYLVKGQGLGFALVFALIIISIGCIGYGVILAIGLTGLILSLINKTALKRKANIILFSIFTALPVITEVILIVTCNVISNLA